MCTLTYIPDGLKTIITSNRDELKTRPTSPPDFEFFNNKGILFPKDEVAGGTWIAYHKSGSVRCILNGAFGKHKRKDQYRKSRGLVLLDSFQYKDFKKFHDHYNFENIEPFTLVSFELGNERNKIQELKWDGKASFYKEFKSDIPQIWSAPALYNDQQRKKRIIWFENWIEAQQNSSNKNILKFHNQRHGDDPKYDILMQRPSGVATTSISHFQIYRGNNLSQSTSNSMLYKDLKNNQETLLEWN